MEFEGIMLNEVSEAKEGKCYVISLVESKRAELIETERNHGCQGLGKWWDVAQMAQTSNFKMNKFWVSNV